MMKIAMFLVAFNVVRLLFGHNILSIKNDDHKLMMISVNVITFLSIIIIMQCK